MARARTGLKNPYVKGGLITGGLMGGSYLLDDKDKQVDQVKAKDKRSAANQVNTKRPKVAQKVAPVKVAPVDVLGKGSLRQDKTEKRKPENVRAGRGTSQGNKGYETMREYFVEDLTPRKSKVKTPLGIIDIDTKEDMDAETRDILEMAQKKGGRLRKGKIKTSTRKRAALRGHRAELRGS